MEKGTEWEMRLESIGGLGANLCGKILGVIGAMHLNLYASAFSEYGSEKRGSAVKAHVRWSAREIVSNSPVQRPDILAIFHDALIDAPAVTEGAHENCLVVVNTPDDADTVRKRLRLHGGTVFAVDASTLAMQTKSRVNTVMLGAICKATGCVDLQTLRAVIHESFAEKYPSTLQANLAGAEEGFARATGTNFAPNPNYPYQPFQESQSKWGYFNAPMGGANPHFGSTVSNDLSASREGFVPLFHAEKCIHCGLCDSTCPDMVFQFLEGEYRGKRTLCNQGLDYRHCKGCLRCVQVCPTGALTAGLERENKSAMRYVRNKDLIVKTLPYETAGADASVTGESYTKDGFNGGKI